MCASASVQCPQCTVLSDLCVRVFVLAAASTRWRAGGWARYYRVLTPRCARTDQHFRYAPRADRERRAREPRLRRARVCVRVRVRVCACACVRVCVCA